jgi:hypothetical protein
VRPLALVLVACALASPAAAAPAGGAKPASLQAYLASMSWPVRASALRTRAATSAIEGWLTQGDPPFLGGVAGNCRSFRAVELDDRGGLLQITAPPRLERSHLRIVRTYSAARAACGTVRLAALAFRAADERAFRTHRAADEIAADRLEAVARRELRLGRTTLESFGPAVRAWRTAASAEADAAGVRALWLSTLPV